MFVHLRIHSEFSIIDGTNRVGDLIKFAAADGQPAMAMTDLNSLFGGIKFYKAGRNAGVKPILGAELVMEPEVAGGQPSRVIVLIQSPQGYLSLAEILARMWTADSAKGATCTWAWLQELSDGLILLSGAQAGPVGQALLRGDEAGARASA
ncbi:MAG: PHP domain-containing protein, partial [Comamonas sp.]